MPDWEKIVRVAQATNALIVAMAGIHSVQNQDLKERGIGVCLHKPIIYKDVLLAIERSTELGLLILASLFSATTPTFSTDAGSSARE
jgi:hypothetical protein